ncbi:hypothetical protein AOLI_G00193370 [Acnodon oligacanthus]
MDLVMHLVFILAFIISSSLSSASEKIHYSFVSRQIPAFLSLLLQGDSRDYRHQEAEYVHLQEAPDVLFPVDDGQACDFSAWHRQGKRRPPARSRHRQCYSSSGPIPYQWRQPAAVPELAEGNQWSQQQT